MIWPVILATAITLKLTQCSVSEHALLESHFATNNAWNQVKIALRIFITADVIHISFPRPVQSMMLSVHVLVPPLDICNTICKHIKLPASV